MVGASVTGDAVGDTDGATVGSAVEVVPVGL